MHHGAVLVNTGRGSLVNEEDVAAALSLVSWALIVLM